jgi:hypothetical protein
MEPYERTTASFIVKVWVEEINDGVTQKSWRGHITHVTSGQRRYLQTFGEIQQFILPYLWGMGVPMPPTQQEDRG